MLSDNTSCFLPKKHPLLSLLASPAHFWPFFWGFYNYLPRYGFPLNLTWVHKASCMFVLTPSSAIETSLSNRSVNHAPSLLLQTLISGLCSVACQSSAFSMVSICLLGLNVLLTSMSLCHFQLWSLCWIPHSPSSRHHLRCRICIHFLTISDPALCFREWITPLFCRVGIITICKYFAAYKAFLFVSWKHSQMGDRINYPNPVVTLSSFRGDQVICIRPHWALTLKAKGP